MQANDSNYPDFDGNKIVVDLFLMVNHHLS